jgi:glycosyltransferase involved in cell wall biosynthesis
VKISAYIPCYNNEETIGAVIRSIKNQTISVEQLFVCDDGSTDQSVKICKRENVPVIENNQNLGRGHVRAQAMTTANHDLVFCCDATKEAAPDFLEKCIPLFKDNKLAAVVGQITQKKTNGSIDRWRSLYLYREKRKDHEIREGHFITFGALVRKSAIMDVGNYNHSLKHSEDLEMGEKLASNGWKILFHPQAKVYTLLTEPLAKVLERYWRWNAGKNEPISIYQYLKNINYSIKVMAWNDIKNCDLPRAFISLISPHYQFWRTVFRKIK